MSELKTYVVPLAHDTLTKEEVAARCVKAAEAKGYVESQRYRTNRKFYFAVFSSGTYNFHNHDCQPYNTLTTLEAFEEYCGVTDEAKQETPEQRIANLEDKLDRLADILADKLQEPQVDAKADDRVVIDGLFFGDEGDDSLFLPDGSALFIDGPTAEPTWGKQALSATPRPHTLITVEKHTVGKFYLLKFGDPNNFDHYALCLSAVNFVYAKDVEGVVTISTIIREIVTLQEVQPLNQ